MNNDQYYNNNPALKSRTTHIRYTQQQIDEIYKCQTDIVHFLKNYVYIISLDEGRVLFDPYGPQIKMLKTCKDNRFTIFNIERQFGKCVSGNSTIKIRNKKTKEIVELPIEEFYQLNKKSISPT